MKKLLFPIIIFMASTVLPAQQSKFDSVYDAVSKETIRMKWAVSMADSLYRNSESEEQKARASMLSASLLYRTGMTNEALQHAARANSLAEKSDLHDLQARICGLISTIYRTSGLHVQGKVFLEKALKASKKIKDPENSFKFQGNLHQEMAYYAMDEKNHSEAVDILNKGKLYFEKLSNAKEKNFLMATNEELLAKNYVALKRFKEAFSSYRKALDHLEKSGQESALKGFIYNGMGNISIAENEYENAINYFHQALEIAETSQFMALQDEVYQSLMQYYKTTKNQEKYIEFNEKYIALRNEHEESNKLSTNHVVTELQTREKSAVLNLYTIAGISSFLILAGFGSYFYIRRKRKREIIQFQQIIKELNDKSIVNAKETSELPQLNSTKDFIPAETEQKILEKFNEFEKTKKYLEKGFTLPMLAVELETNTKYLSHIIKKHKKSDFNTYINRLKIAYIIKKLHSEPIYANYKISYLAEECGFSSHSKFTTVFKNETGVSPTTFLSLLGEERAKQQ